MRLPESDSRPGCSAYSWTTEGQASSCLLVVGVEAVARLLEARGYAARLVVVAARLADLVEPLDPAGLLDQLVGAGVVAADGLGDLGEVADPVGRDHLADLRGVPDVDVGEGALVEVQAALGEQPARCW